MAIRQKIGMLCCAGTLLCAMLMPGAAQAQQATIYMQIEGIKGDVTAQGHEDWINVVSVGYSFIRQISTPTGSAQERESSAPSVSEIKVLKNLDISTPLLLTEALVGRAKQVTIHFVTPGFQLEVFFELILTDTLISAIRHSFQPDGGIIESLSLNYTKIEWKLTPFDNEHKPGAPIPGSWDVLSGRAG